MTYSEEQARTDLAALYRMVAHFRMTDLVDTHISVRVPGHDKHFLINTYGVQFHQMTPGDLVKINPAGEAVDGQGDTPRVNAAGFVIHSAVHMARHDLQCVIHTHTADGIAVACMEEGLLPISQHALKFYQRIGYHEYEGIALDTDERERLVGNLGTHQAMILRNHGLLVAGRTVPEAFLNLMYLERACQIQVRATASGRKIRVPPPAVCEKTARQYEQSEGLEHARFVWDSMLTLLQP
jgi:ribulose-5-phosphate 4-epimerase/fuculose-1-phosphate aldolase